MPEFKPETRPNQPIHMPPIFPPEIEKEISSLYDNFTVNSEKALERITTNPSFKGANLTKIHSDYENFNHEQRAFAFAAMGKDSYFNYLRPQINNKMPEIISTIDQIVNNIDFKKGADFLDLYKIVRLAAE
mgnify:CR=1 FL=1